MTSCSAALPLPDYGEQLTPKLEAAERSMRKGNKASTLCAFSKETLTAMCHIRGLDTNGTKSVLASRLVEFVSVIQVEVRVLRYSSAG